MNLIPTEQRKAWRCFRRTRRGSEPQIDRLIFRQLRQNTSAALQSEALAFRDELYHPHWIDESCLNNNSTVKFFRRGSFNLLSLGDVESADISARLRQDKYLSRETDVMILAHHGADNGFTNKSFLERKLGDLLV
jgi:competence protein ComEC